MKRLFFAILVSLCIVSCNNKRIVSNIPIKSEILGVELCKKMSLSEVENALMEHTEKFFLTTSEKVNNIKTYRSIPISLSFIYGSLDWMWCDVVVNEENEVVSISLMRSYEEIDDAEDRYNQVVEIFSDKYGKANISDDNSLAFWTDDSNSVGVQYYDSSAINGNDRSFCELYYINIALSDKLEQDNQLDI